MYHVDILQFLQKDTAVEALIIKSFHEGYDCSRDGGGAFYPRQETIHIATALHENHVRGLDGEQSLW